ncbi:lipoprotein [Streptomyces sp. NPDC007905]|uniref:membrane lipoprotein lipid attachment site-containing protein n=1 Tax=Streptomyces sp. NPDC007905 TaxID=3364788 RepID=UPI0036E22791
MRRTLLALSLMVALTGCSLLGRDTPCTRADADSHVSVVWRPSDFGGADAARVRLCVGGACREQTSGDPEDPFGSVTVRLPDRIGASTVPVKLTVTSARTGDPVVQDSTRARLTEQHPNGTSCPPTVRTATYRADPGKGLTSPKGMSLQGT